MKDKYEDLLSYCSKLDFGLISLSGRQMDFYSELNNEIIQLCKSLPKSIQTEALLFFMRYSGISFGQELDFFKNCYVPSWSFIYWLTQNLSNSKVSQKDIKNAITAHSMAMMLHSLDDHINDNQVPASHLTLLLRSQSWMIMNNAFKMLATGVDDGEKIVQGFIDDYYSGICSSEKTGSLDDYCNLFRNQMTTCLIVPVLIAKKMTYDEAFVDAAQAAYSSFGIAWRLLDDIMDIETDMITGTHSAIYVCLPEYLKDAWDKKTVEKKDKISGRFKSILSYILKDSVIDRIKERICNELGSAAAMAECYDMKDMAEEFRCLSIPLENSGL